MERAEFWLVVEESGRDHEGDAQVAEIERRLSALSPEDVLSFERHLRALLAESYRQDLWGAAYLINGGCSDDGFDYFRGWLIAQGHETYQRALADPDSLAKIADLEEPVELESLWYAAGRVYEGMTGDRIPQSVYQTSQPADLGEPWDFDDDAEMERRYPKLFARFC